MIKDTLKNAIRNLSAKYEVGEKEIRIKISKPNGNLKYEIMKNSVVLEETNVATALNLNAVVAFMVGNRLSAIVDSLVNDFGVAEDKVNVRIYTKTDNCEPLLYLFNDTTPVQGLDIDNFI